MNKLQKIGNYILHPLTIKDYISWKFVRHGLYNYLSDEKYLSCRYSKKMKKNLNLENPLLFTEKLQWLKINDRNKLYTKMVDKYEAKEYIEAKVGKKYVVPTLGLYNSFDEIDFSSLPNDFIMKCTHNSGGAVVCVNRGNLDIKAARKKINKCLNHNHYYSGREWPYKNVKPRIIIEKLLSNSDGSEVVEYNFFCFNGVPKLVMTCHGDKRIKRYNDFYDMDFNKMNLKCEYDNSSIVEKKPKQFEQMVSMSKKLSENIPHLRVDLYLCDDKIYVGELTFFHWGGFCKFEPEMWDEILGSWIDL